MYLLMIFPYLYFLRTRLKGKIQRLSWIFIYFIPNIFLYLYVTDFEFSFNNLSIMILSLILINYIYDNGYIQNDVILTKKEKNPTLRIDGKLLEDLRKNIIKIFIFRFFIAAFILFYLFLFIDDAMNFLTFLSISILLQFLYLIYNSTRTVLNLYLILPLSYFRFYGFIIPFVSQKDLVGFIFLTILIYPLSKFLEFTKQPRYKYEYISKMVANVDVFRVKYYLIVFIIFLLLYNFFYINLVYVFIVFYYLVFRILSYFAISRIGSVKKDIFNNSKKEYRG